MRGTGAACNVCNCRDGAALGLGGERRRGGIGDNRETFESTVGEVQFRPEDHPDFTFDRERNIYICPGGAELTSTGNVDQAAFFTTEPTRMTARPAC